MLLLADDGRTAVVTMLRLPVYSGSAARVLFNVAEASFAAKKEW